MLLKEFLPLAAFSRLRKDIFDSLDKQIGYSGKKYKVAYTANDEKTLKRELSSLRKIRDSYPKYLLTLDYDTSNIDGIQRLNVIDWMLDVK